MKNKSYKLFCSGGLIQEHDLESLNPSEARAIVSKLNIRPGGTDQNQEGRNLMRVLLKGCEEDVSLLQKNDELQRSVEKISALLDQQQKITKNLLELFIISVGGTPPGGDS